MNEKEAAQAIAGGADIVDVKNPNEGPLGANFPWVIRRIKQITPPNIQVSCTIGEVPNLPGSMSLAALGAASIGVDYIKVGLYGFQTEQEAIVLLDSVNRAAKECNPNVKVVAAGYGDAQRVGALDPLQIPEVAFKAHVDVAMLDTAVKDGKNLFAFLSSEKIKRFVDYSHYLGLQVALAGSLRKEDLPVVASFGADFAGVRGAACIGGDRNKGELKAELVRELADLVRTISMQAVKRA
jgi:uncharacterized protein (UPF0264 family)